MKEYFLTNVTYFDNETCEMIENQYIKIANGRILEINSMNNFQSQEEAINLAGKFLLPGLIDTHIHFFQSAGLYTRPDGLDLRHVKSYEKEIDEIKSNIPNLFKRYLACGVTSIIDDGGPMWNKEIKQQADEAGTLAPNVKWAGPLVSTVSREKLDIGDAPIIKADNEDHARELVNTCASGNPDYIKFWYIYQQESFEEDSLIMAAGIEEARKLGFKVMVHSTELETAKRAVQYGANILVHSVMEEDVDQEFIDLLLEKNVIYIPTLVVRKGYRDVYRCRLELSDFEQKWGDPDVVASFRDLMILDEETVPESHRELRKQWNQPPPKLKTYTFPNLRRLARAGVKIATGTDAGNVGTLHGPSLHYEMEMMVDAGMNVADVLISTTSLAAEVMGQTDVGVISEGNIADLVVLNKNPIQDIKNTRLIDQVIRRGEIHNPDDLITPTLPEDPVQRQLEAYNNRNIDAFLACYHPRVKLYNMNNNELIMDGIEQMRPRFEQLFEVSPNLKSTVVNRSVVGNIVSDTEHVTGFRGDGEANLIAVHEIENQLITKVWFVR